MTIHFIFKSYTLKNITLVLELFESIFQRNQLGVFRYPTKIQKLTVLKSPHVHKKSREQFEVRTHKTQITINQFDRSQLDSLIQSIQSFKILGVQMQVRVNDSTELYIENA